MEPSFWPIAMGTTVGYQWAHQTLVDSDRGQVDTQIGTFGFAGLDVFAVGTLAICNCDVRLGAFSSQPTIAGQRG
jgi:hypothetical protein